ncbi:hypothetical protein M501DRAFT_979141 [Patellaria atrata CBS 101060]|uniref:Cysteine-rich PDZ-binding protein n=1 Tax=Patellaria atrata CBS 101060 TaxID=1346257 RepID=A0A9P4S7P5_9PEZI|nr:hypothetical protein M501DRAFT_979141 [Patellaria atrata CBS 101060]
MVCTKCAKNQQRTQLATPAVKKKTDSYTLPSAGKGPTLGTTGVSKSKLLTKPAKNPLLQISSNCDGCKTRTTQGHKFCQRCAYSKNACTICGKNMSKASSKALVVEGQKFSNK